jgi:hypothetical protein
MENKFSALARDQYLGFLVRQNLLMLVAYAILALIATILAQPLASFWTRRSAYRKFPAVALRGFLIVAMMHGFCTLRLMDTRPYFLDQAEFGQWYYKALDLLPQAVKPAGLFTLFTLLPLAFIGLSLGWQIHRRGRIAWQITAVIAIGLSSAITANHLAHRPQVAANPPHHLTSSSSAPIPCAPTASAARDTARNAPMAPPPPASRPTSTPWPPNPPASRTVIQRSPRPSSPVCN